MVDINTHSFDKGDIVIAIFLGLKKTHLIWWTLLHAVNEYMRKVYVEMLLPC